VAQGRSLPLENVGAGFGVPAILLLSILSNAESRLLSMYAAISMHMPMARRRHEDFFDANVISFEYFLTLLFCFKKNRTSDGLCT
jgi:hypothetical protein